MKSIVRLIFRIYFQLFYNVKLEGFENIPRGNYIIAPNHRKENDAPFLIAFLPMEFGGIGKQEISAHPIYRYFTKIFHFVGLERDGKDFAAIRQSIELLKQFPLVLFVEGTTTEDRGRLDAKPGLAMIANKAGVPILPVTIWGDYKLFSTMKLIIHPARTVESFGKTKLNSQAYTEIGEELLDIIYRPMEVR